MKGDSDKGTCKWLYLAARGQYARILIIIICNALMAALGVWFALVCKGVIDNAVQKNMQGLRAYSGLLLGVVVLQFLLRLLCNNLLEYVRSYLENQLRQKVLLVLMEKEYSSLTGYHSGELLNRMFSDVQEITDCITGILPSLVNMSVQLVLAAAVLISIEPKLALLLLIAGALVFGGTSLFRRSIKRMHKKMKESEGRVRSFLQEAVESLLVIKVFGIEKKIGSDAEALQKEYFKARMRKRNITICANAAIQLGFRLGYFLTMMWGAVGIYLGTISYGSLTALLQLVGQVQSPFMGLSGIGPRVYGMLASAERLMEIEKLPTEKDTGKISVQGEISCPVAERLYHDMASVCFGQVYFSYGREEVLKCADFEIHKGDFAAVTGLSGGGKSTLFLLLMGVYQPAQGQVFLKLKNGTYPLGKETRNLFAYVPQGNYLFSGTLRENITMLRPNASEEEVCAAIEIACADEFISKLPEKLDTPIGERGHGFSEGQVQRIAVARALLYGAPILLLDEATSALDERTEARMLENISRMREKTCFIVTHRKAALDVCNKEINIENGHVHCKEYKK